MLQSSTGINPANRIDWNGKFVALKPEWYQDCKVTRVAGSLLLACSIGLGMAAVSFTAKPIIVLGGTALALYCLFKACWNDPVYLTEQGKNEEKEILEKGLSYNEIQQSPLRRRIPFTNDDYNRLFRDRIMDPALPYETLKNALGNFSFLDDRNSSKIKEKFSESMCGKLLRGEDKYDQFISDLGDNIMFLSPLVADRAIEWFVDQNFGLVEILNRPDAIALKLNRDQLIKAGVLNQDLFISELTYSQFKAKHSLECIDLINSKEFEQLKSIYLRSAYPVLRENSDDAPKFGLNADEVLKERRDQEIKTISSFEEIIDRLGTSVFTDGILKQTDPWLKRHIIQYLIRHGYHIESTPLKQFDLMTENVNQEVLSSLEKEAAVVVQLEEANTEYQKKLKKLNEQNAQIQEHARIVDRLRSGRNKLSQIESNLKEHGNIKNELKQLNEKIAKLDYDIKEATDQMHSTFRTAQASIGIFNPQKLAQAATCGAPVGGLLEQSARHSGQAEKLKMERDKIKAKVSSKAEELARLDALIVEKENTLKDQRAYSEALSRMPAMLQKGVRESSFDKEKLSLEEKKKQLQLDSEAKLQEIHEAFVKNLTALI